VIRGDPLSSAILYLAIIAIWACVLVPRWIHKPHRVPAADELPGLKYVGASGQPDRRGASASGHAPPAAWAAASAATARTDPASVSTGHTAAASTPTVSAPTANTADIGAPAAGAPTANTVDIGAATVGAPTANTADIGAPAVSAPTAGAATGSAPTAGAATSSADADVGAGNADAGQAGAADGRYATADSSAPQPTVVEEGVAWHRVTRSYHSEHQGAQQPQMEAPGRAHVLQARRRLLTTLVTLAIAALACTAANLAPWWIVVPPVGMLGMYVLLLREAAQADAEQARWLAKELTVQAEAARLRPRQAWEAGQPQPTAEIIDISGRVTDQLYDQYADAAVRAVGD
jgi:hypothetical protein